MGLLSRGITEFRSVHDNHYFDSRLSQILKELIAVDAEYNKTPADHARKRFHILKEQSRLISQISAVLMIRNIRVEDEYKAILEHIDGKHKEAKKKFSAYEKEVKSRLDDAMKKKEIKEEHLGSITKEHRDSKARMEAFHGSVKTLKHEIEDFRKSLRDGCRESMRKTKIYYKNA